MQVFVALTKIFVLSIQTGAISINFSFTQFFVKLHEFGLQFVIAVSSGSWLNFLRMATFSAKVFKHHKKADGTYNVYSALVASGIAGIDTVH